MKLYTEEQVKRAIDIADDNADLLEYNEILSKLTPIELPSDEEIDAIANDIGHNYFVMQRNHYEGLIEGSKRMAYLLMKHFKQQ